MCSYIIMERRDDILFPLGIKPSKENYVKDKAWDESLRYWSLNMFTFYFRMILTKSVTGFISDKMKQQLLRNGTNESVHHSKVLSYWVVNEIYLTQNTMSPIVTIYEYMVFEKS